MGRVRAAAARCLLLGAAGLLIASCAETPPPPPPPPPPAPKPVVFWPTHGWKNSTPEEQGLDSNVLADAIQAIRDKHLPVHSLLIERHGAIVLDAYFHPFADNQLHNVESVTKSVVSTLVGIAQAKQQLADLNTPVVSLFSESKPAADARKAHLTLAHLLSMTSGLDCGAKDGQSFLQQMENSKHWSAFALERRETAEPGALFNYCAVNMELASALLSRKTGANAAQLASRELFSPLGIQQFEWPSDGDGISHGFADLKLQPRDMAKLGYLWLHHGVWEDRQIVPAAYLDEALTPHADISERVKYGYGIWLYPNGRNGGPPDFEANGTGGQRIAVIPSQDMVVVVTAAGADDNQLAALLAPATKADSALPANPQADARLAALVTEVANPSDVRLVEAAPKSIPVPMPRPEQPVLFAQPALPDVIPAEASPITTVKNIPVPLPRPNPPAVVAQAATSPDLILADGTAKIEAAPQPAAANSSPHS